jgi:hypothetical protein|tara:strand:+ start:337 stop:480 length:144 start_codon:yes stop_codon:yes gene_type:complete
MSFGGGSDGSTGVTDHVHSAEVGEGGSLSIDDTLIDNTQFYGLVLVD